MTAAGSCLCGAVRFLVDGAVGPFEMCHCNRCRKVSGGQGLPMVTVRTEDFRMTRGVELIVSFEAPILYQGPAYQTHRCSICGSPVPTSSTSEAVLEIPAGLFDQDPGLRPDKHIFVELVPEWDQITDTLPQYDIRSLMEERMGKPVAKDFEVRSHSDGRSE